MSASDKVVRFKPTDTPSMSQLVAAQRARNEITQPSVRKEPQREKTTRE